MVPLTSSQTIWSALRVSSAEPKTPDLEFVTVSNPKDVLSTSNQQRIRRHARRSVPDAGRWRRKPFSRTFELAQIPPPPSYEHYYTNDTLPDVPTHGLSNYSQFPVETTPRMRELISFACHNATTVYNPTFRPWFRIALANASAFYMTLSYAALELNRLHKGNSSDELGENGEALSLYNLSLQDVQVRLRDPSDNGVLGGVLGFACKDVTTGDFFRSKSHLRALGQLLDTREILLTQTTADFQIMIMDIDVSSSFAQDISPIFPVPLGLCQDVFRHYDSLSSPALDMTLQLWLDHFPGDADIISAFRWVTALAMFVKENSSTPQFWMEDRVAQMTLVVLHRLLSLRRLDLPMKEGTEFEGREVVRLTLIIFLSNLKLRQGFIHGGNAALYCKRVEDLVRYHPDWSFLLNLQLWTLVVCGIEQQQFSASQDWYSNRIAEIMMQMGLREWTSALSTVCDLVWIDDLAAERVASLRTATENKLKMLNNGLS